MPTSGKSQDSRKRNGTRGKNGSAMGSMGNGASAKRNSKKSGGARKRKSSTSANEA